MAVVYPDLLGTYGDGGNGLILARRAAWRGIEAELVQADVGPPAPVGRPLLHRRWRGRPPGPGGRSPGGRRALAGPWRDGAVVLGVCAGFQLLGRTFPDAADRPHDGLGLLDVTTRKGTGTRPVGELVATVDAGCAPGRPTASACPR